MNEFEKNFAITDIPRKTAEDNLKQKTAEVENRLEILAQIVGADFGMKVKFGKLGEGSFFDSKNNSITLDPQMLLEDREYEAEFIAGHEGGHRAITKSLEQIGVSQEKILELYKKIGFGYLSNCLEDCADNNWVGEAFEKFKEDSEKVYTEQFEKENTAMTTPEINKAIAQLGYVPKFVFFGSEIIRQWATGKYSHKLEKEVERALQKTENEAKNCWQEIPKVYSREGERLKKAKERFRIIYEKIWPEFERLVNMDIDQEKMRQLAEKLGKQSGEEKESEEKNGAEYELSEELQKELAKKMEENNKSVPWDKLSEELKNKLKEIFENLSEDEKKKLEKKAKKMLEDLDDKLIEESRGKLAKKASPLTHEEIEALDEKEKSEDKTKNKENDETRQKEKAENERILKELSREMEGELNKYDKIYQEIAPLADELFNRIHKIFLPKRHPRWQKGYPNGQRLDLAKAMQFEADRGLYEKIWERKTIPQKIDYRFTLLNDLSVSMAGEKIEQDFRGKILIAEVLNRLGIKTQILGFQDDIIPYKNFDAELSSEIRKKMLVMLKEVEDKGNHNRARWNSDGYCLKKASEDLEKQKGKDSFLIVFSDGEPAPDPEHSGKEYELKKVVNEIRKNTKQKLIGVGLGQDTGHVAKFYPTSLPNLPLDKLPQMLGDLLEDMIQNPEKYK